MGGARSRASAAALYTLYTVCEAGWDWLAVSCDALNSFRQRVCLASALLRRMRLIVSGDSCDGDSSCDAVDCDACVAAPRPKLCGASLYLGRAGDNRALSAAVATGARAGRRRRPGDASGDDESTWLSSSSKLGLNSSRSGSCSPMASLPSDRVGAASGADAVGDGPKRGSDGDDVGSAGADGGASEARRRAEAESDGDSRCSAGVWRAVAGPPAAATGGEVSSLPFVAAARAAASRAASRGDCRRPTAVDGGDRLGGLRPEVGVPGALAARRRDSRRADAGVATAEVAGAGAVASLSAATSAVATVSPAARSSAIFFVRVTAGSTTSGSVAS